MTGHAELAGYGSGWGNSRPRLTYFSRPAGGQAGFSLIGAIITLSLLTSIGLLMAMVAVHFERLSRESRHGVQLEAVLDALLLRYRHLGHQGHRHEFIHVTLGGMVPVTSADQPSPPDWIDTVEVDIWEEQLPRGRRLWGTARSSFSRRAATLLHYIPPAEPS